MQRAALAQGLADVNGIVMVSCCCRRFKWYCALCLHKIVFTKNSLKDQIINPPLGVHLLWNLERCMCLQESCSLVQSLVFFKMMCVFHGMRKERDISTEKLLLGLGQRVRVAGICG